MWTRLIAIGIAAWLLWVLDDVIPSYANYPLVGATFGFLGGCWYVSGKIVRPAGRPPPLTGPPLAKAGWLTGSIGEIPLMKHIWVTVYADRLVVRMPLIGTRTVMADELTWIDRYGSRWPPEWKIEHAAAGLASPITLRLRRGPLVDALYRHR